MTDSFDEFPHREPDWNQPASRRRFLEIMGASMALASTAACTKQPPEKIVPYVRQPEEAAPGEAMFYATSFVHGGLATGILVESHSGRPTKVEGNPQHPASLGAADCMMQASVLSLYDPDRSQAVIHNSTETTAGEFISALAAARDSTAAMRGEGIRILTGKVTSPTLAAQIRQFLTAYPQARWHQYDACCSHSAYQGAMAAFGAPLNTLYRFDRADVVVSLDSDFVSCPTPGSLRYARDYAARRRLSAQVGGRKPARLYVAESAPSCTGGIADHRYRMRASDVGDFARRILAGAGGAEGVIARELEANRGSGIVIAGEYQPAEVHALAHALNAKYGNAGQTVVYTDPVEAEPVDPVASIGELVSDMNRGAVRLLLIEGGNPVYDAPADLGFSEALARVPFSAHLSLYRDETSRQCHWHVPRAHALESWGDARAWDGTVGLLQPLIEPLYGGLTLHECMNVLNGSAAESPLETVKEHWRSEKPGPGFEEFWQTSLHDGVIAGTALPVRSAPAIGDLGPQPAAASREVFGLEIVFRPDQVIGGGEYSNNAWLQELPRPQSQMTWDNAVWISPATARQMGLATGDVAEIGLQGRRVTGPVWVMPGHADGSATVHLGYGRTHAGRVANGVGFNAYAIRNGGSMWNAAGARLTKRSGGYEFATRQKTETMEGRDPYRLTTYAAAYRQPDFANPPEQRVAGNESLFPMWPYPGHRWAMAIDLDACTGCSACMVACQAENNIPVVGKEEVAKGRHMNWLRVDRYFKGREEDPALYFQPVPCMHCETAPCELVCPVAATVHSGEGLNQMVYNRCVGTRYCSNNCPYKVRRFNFFLYSDWYTPSLEGVRNPDVTVRSRGVMEKCTYCVQRINAVKIEAEKHDNRPIRDGEIVPACAQTCPTQAIVFGDLSDPNSRVSRMKKEQRNYALLEELNTNPRTTYQARLVNPHPELDKAADS